MIYRSDLRKPQLIDIFRLLYIERLKPSAITATLNRQPSGIAPGNWKKAWATGYITLPSLPQEGGRAGI
jgi:hypothetical protein